MFLYVQVCLGNISLENYQVKSENSSPHQTLMAIFQAAPRIAKGTRSKIRFAAKSILAICQVCLERHFGSTSRAALELVHVVLGKAWEDSPTIFRQLSNIGELAVAYVVPYPILRVRAGINQSTWHQWYRE